MKYKKCNPRYIIAFFIIILCFSLAIFSISNNKNTILENFVGSTMPKTIWTFWDGIDVPDIVNKCIGTWKKYNPNYKVIILNKKNLSKYLPDVDFSKIKHIHENAIERFSDMVRLQILYKYGGIWSDASIICLKPYDSWIPQLFKKNDNEFVGFYTNAFTLPEYEERSPVIESWFFACIPKSNFMKDWLNEFLRISDFDTVDNYVKNVKSQGINLQHLPSGIFSYLSIYVACQKVLQTQKSKYKLQLLKTDETGFKYIIKYEWNSTKAITNLLECKDPNKKRKDCDILETPLMKLRGDDRKELETRNYSNFFDKI